MHADRLDPLPLPLYRVDQKRGRKKEGGKGSGGREKEDCRLLPLQCKFFREARKKKKKKKRGSDNLLLKRGNYRREPHLFLPNLLIRSRGRGRGKGKEEA